MAIRLALSNVFVAVALVVLPTQAFAQQTGRPPSGQPGTVTLSLSDYDRLVARAERPTRTVEPPPIPATVSRAEVVVRIAGDRARGIFTLEGEVFATGLTRVPLLKGAPIVDARIGTTPVALVRDGDVTVALIEGPRTFAVTLEWGAAVAASPGRAGVALPVPAAGTVTATFDLPPAAADVQVHSGALTRTSTTTAAVRVEATLVPGSDARISWAVRRTESQASRNVRTIATVHSLVSLREAETRIASIVEVSVLSGQPDRLEVEIPSGYTFAGVSGAAVESAEESAGVVSVRLSRPQERRHQMVVSFERPGTVSGAFEVPLPRIVGAERETGEVALDATGTVELTLKETDALKRMDVREAGPALLSLAGHGVLAALRYQRRSEAPLMASGEVTRFPDAALITAVADRAVATTLVTVDGRTLTEVILTLRNRAQPFLRVELPAGASMVSAEVAGQTAKLASAPDGARVPLLRPGFRPNGPYSVSFVYVQSGQPFQKKGRAELLLPRMDVPIGIVEWEMFVPDRYRVRRFEGDAMFEPPAAPVYHAFISSPAPISGLAAGTGGGTGGGVYAPSPGRLVGRVTDSSGNPIPGVKVTALHDGATIAEALTNEAGYYLLPGVSGRATVIAEIQGFRTAHRRVDAGRSRQLDLRLDVGETTETVTVEAESVSESRDRRDEAAQAPSQNVFNLQRRVEGVLPVRVDVPRAGSAYRFVRPLVIDEVTTVAFDYRAK